MPTKPQKTGDKEKRWKGVFVQPNPEEIRMWEERAIEAGFVKDGKPLLQRYIRSLVATDLQNRFSASEMGRLKSEFVNLRKENAELRQVNIGLQKALSKTMLGRDSETLRKVAVSNDEKHFKLRAEGLTDDEIRAQGLEWLTEEEISRLSAEITEQQEEDDMWANLSTKEKMIAHELTLTEHISVIDAMKRIIEGRIHGNEKTDDRDKTNRDGE